MSIRQTTNPQNGAGLTVDSAAAPGPYTVVGNACTNATTTGGTSGGTTTGGTSGGTGGGTSGGVTTGALSGGANESGGNRLGSGGAFGLLALVPGFALAWRRRRRRG